MQHTVCKGKKRSSDKRIQYFFKHYNMTPLDMYNRLSQVYCIKPEGRIHKNTKVNRYTEQNFYLATLHFYVNSVIQNTCLYKSTNALPKLWIPFQLKMTGTSCTDDAKGTLVSKSHFFLQYEIFHRYAIHVYFCLYEDISDCCD